jgi:hypothetical protein
MPMSTRVSLLLSLTALSCTQVIPAPPPPDAPRIERFETASRVINVGESASLSFTTVGATRVTMVDDQGQAIQLEGTVEEGSTEVSPSRTTFYVLRAQGPGGVTSAFVQIAVNEPLREAFLLAVPPEVEAGEPVQLLWSAPGASSVTLTQRGGMPVALTGASGIIPITPMASTGYRLTAQGVTGTPPVEALVELRVRPAIASFDFMAANGVRVGEPIVFSWTTRAASRLTISEATLGLIKDVTAAGELATGTFNFVLPATIPSGMAITDGFPLRFTLTAISGEDQSTREVSTAVGNLPSFENVTAPAAVSQTKDFVISWRTLNASRLTIKLDGQSVFETLPSAPDRAATGSVSLRAPATDSDYVLIAADERGQVAQRTVRVRVVPLPVIGSFTVPGNLAFPGSQGMASWTTTNATAVTLRLEGGPSLHRFTAPSIVRMGSTPFVLGSNAAVSLEAVNSAGDFVTETRTVRVAGTPVFVSPQPAFRNDAGVVTLDWALSSLGVTEVVGLNNPTADGGVVSVVNPAAFIDLAASPTATVLEFADPGNGSELLPALDGFSFPLAGQLQRELWVSANGFIAFSKPAALSGNSDLGLPANSIQSMLAPFWDDLTIPPMDGKVLYELMTNSTTGDRFLVVQWDKVRTQAAGTSELTFQAQLSETGEVRFAYKTLTGAINSCTVAVKATHEKVRQRFVYNSAGLVPDLELSFFSGAPANGTRDVTTAGSRRINFFGRTATGLLPLSVELRTVAAGDLLITEAMPFPDVSVASTGMWVEFKNPLDTPIELDGIKIVSRFSADGGGTVLGPRTLMPGEYFLVGQTTDTASSGGAPVQALMTDVPMSPFDTVQLTVQGSAVASLTWDGGTLAQSIFVPEEMRVVPGTSLTCARTQTFGPNGAAGTPGVPNEACRPYVISRVDAGFVELGEGSTELLASASDYSGVGVVVLPTPFTYFGIPYASFNLSLGSGFLNFNNNTPLTTDYGANPTFPAIDTPNGVIAPFWDDLTRNTGTSGNGAVLMQRLADRTIVSWQDFRINPDTRSHINFQVHLFDSGVIEFHYGNLASTTTTASYLPKLRGNGATIWLEHPNGTHAVPFSVNEETITPNMPGIRFTPAP